MTGPTVPANITRDALRAAFTSLGIDITNVTAARFGPHSIELVVTTTIPHPDGGPGQHRILIPIIDGPHQDPLPTVPQGMPTQPLTRIPPLTPRAPGTDTWGTPPTVAFPLPPGETA